jgi:hypothetical protein
MMFGDTTRLGVPFSKDPHVIEYHGRYLMYYTIQLGRKATRCCRLGNRHSGEQRSEGLASRGRGEEGWAVS